MILKKKQLRYILALYTLHKIYENMGEYGSVKTRILACFMQWYCKTLQITLQSFTNNLELNFDSIALRNSYLVVIFDDFNMQRKWWYRLGKTTRIDCITSEFGLEQPIYKPTHITGERSSCMDLIFAPQSILVVESGVKSSMHQKLSSPNNTIHGFQWEK